MSPDLEPQPTENSEPPSLATPESPALSPLSWIPTRRWLIDETGPLPWSVEERQFADGPSLFFMNDDGFVRVRVYPPNWLELPEASLAELLEHPRGKPNPT